MSNFGTFICTKKYFSITSHIIEQDKTQLTRFTTIKRLREFMGQIKYVNKGQDCLKLMKKRQQQGELQTKPDSNNLSDLTS